MTTALAQARVDAGMTQYELADRLGVDQTYVSKYEGGRRRLDVVEFMRIVAALDVDYRDIIAAMRVPNASGA
ncbi:helix-turn-helix domain-containing protein [Brevundimonas diminuta]|uniref:helix-turn-helix domain-containing protein n=1 Tax=Brevundimonas diminuta TaxID=293 RepID=UPI000B2960A9|nr:helix-turn-helix transcriptional regulator [Brevundimonas diminuta]